MKCCNNSEHIRFENLLKEGCEYKSKKKKINIRLSNKHLQNKWNSARFCCQKILAPDPIKCVAKYWLSQRRRTWCTTWWPHPTESAAYQCTGRPPQISPTRLGKKKKTLFTMAPLNNMHKGHCWWQQLARPLSCLSRQISHLTRLPRLIRPSNTTDGTAKTLMKLIEVVTRNHGHFAPVSQWIWTLRGFGPPPPVYIRWRVWTPYAGLDSPYQTFLLSIVYIVFGN